jgi:hypothetical protein
MALIQTKSGRYVRSYFNGTNVGLARMKSLKPDISTPLDPVMELGNPNVAEYVPKVAMTTLTFEYMVISYGQLAKALGITYGSSSANANAINGVVGEVPPIPSSFDIVERLIRPGTEKTANEVYYGYVLHQRILIEKETWDQEADKVISVNITAKSVAPRRYEGINGIKFDPFTGNGSTTAFILSQRAVPGYDGYQTVRADVGGGVSTLFEGFDYTAASTSSNTTVTFNTAPPAGAITIIYAY